MRRALLASLVIILAGAAWLATRAGEESQYRVAVMFDTAKGMVPGQQVKVAGAVIGSVEDVELSTGRKARMVLAVERRFEPFREDASCRILPEGLISENYVECDPGTPERRPLPRGGGGMPTVPVEQTQVPISLQDVINVFSLPTDQRLRLLINELGLATSGRGGDINAILRRANPALSQSRRVLAIVDDQRRELADAVRQTDLVLAELAERDEDVRRFVDRAAGVAETTAPRHRALGESVRRLPRMLDAARPALRSLDRAMASGSPLLDGLRASAPGLEELTRKLPAFSRAGVPALRALSSMARTGRRSIRSARPFVAELETTSDRAVPFADRLDQFLVALRDGGALEGLQHLLYSEATSSGAYDQVSHMYAIYNEVYPHCIADRDAPGCSHAYSAPGNGRIPIDDPDCGPQRPTTWTGIEDPCSATRARRAGDPGRAPRRETGADAARRARAAEPVLDFLLGP